MLKVTVLRSQNVPQLIMGIRYEGAFTRSDGASISGSMRIDDPDFKATFMWLYDALCRLPVIRHDSWFEGLYHCEQWSEVEPVMEPKRRLDTVYERTMNQWVVAHGGTDVR